MLSHRSDCLAVRDPRDTCSCPYEACIALGFNPSALTPDQRRQADGYWHTQRRTNSVSRAAVPTPPSAKSAPVPPEKAPMPAMMSPKYFKLCAKRGLDAGHVDTRARLAMSLGLGPTASESAILEASKKAKALKKAQKVASKQKPEPPASDEKASNAAMKNARLGLPPGATKALRREVIESTARTMNLSAARVKDLTTLSASDLEREIDERRAKGKA